MTVRLLVLAPNWLGDAVMALPALADVRQALPNATIDVAARPPIAPLFTLVPAVNSVLTLDNRRRSIEVLRSGHYEAALLLPNSFNAARLAWSAGIPERWGYRSDFRSPLLTKAVGAPSRVHQTEYYRHLIRELGFGIADPRRSVRPPSREAPGRDLDEAHRTESGRTWDAGQEAARPRLDVSSNQRDAGRALLAEDGWDLGTPLIAVAPGAAFGGAKRWPATSFAAVIDALAIDGLRAVLVGAAADRPAATEVFACATTPIRPINLVGRTDLPMLAGVLVHCRALVTNDSGAMHLAAALGVTVTAMFGPTRERETHPLGHAHTVLTSPVWCRPCMLRECPLTHRCMTGISVDSVLTATRARL